MPSRSRNFSNFIRATCYNPVWQTAARLLYGGGVAQGKDAVGALDAEVAVHHQRAPVLLTLQLMRQLLRQRVHAVACRAAHHSYTN